MLKMVAKYDHDALTTYRAYMDGKIRVAYETNLVSCRTISSLGPNMNYGY